MHVICSRAAAPHLPPGAVAVARGCAARGGRLRALPGRRLSPPRPDGRVDRKDAAARGFTRRRGIPHLWWRCTNATAEPDSWGPATAGCGRSCSARGAPALPAFPPPEEDEARRVPLRPRGSRVPRTGIQPCGSRGREGRWDRAGDGCRGLLRAPWTRGVSARGRRGGAVLRAVAHGRIHHDRTPWADPGCPCRRDAARRTGLAR
mmetsp:Transcript_11580/g.34946  ORF Transcript_11580/g.34946 Transcript_11580/m.34946 type:complete len:205 (+) Transcript_11580:646-1260(+)